MFMSVLGTKGYERTIDEMKAQLGRRLGWDTPDKTPGHQAFVWVDFGFLAAYSPPFSSLNSRKTRESAQMSRWRPSVARHYLDIEQTTDDSCHEEKGNIEEKAAKSCGFIRPWVHLALFPTHTKA